MENEEANTASDTTPLTEEQAAAKRIALYVDYAKRFARPERVEIEPGHGQKLTQPASFAKPSKRKFSKDELKKRDNKQKKARAKRRKSGGMAMIGSFSKRSSGQKFSW